MKTSSAAIVAWMLAGLWLVPAGTPSAMGQSAPEPSRIVGYVPSWQDIWSDPSQIDGSRLTHVNFAFADIADGEVVLGSPGDTVQLAMLRQVKAQHPHLRTLVSVGGWTRSTHFSDVSLTDESRRRFADSAVRFAVEYGFDGVDIDWEYPGQPGNNNPHRPEDRENFTALLRELRFALNAQSDRENRPDDNRYLLTIATGANQRYLDHTELDVAHRYLDFINIMTYDFAGGWAMITGHHANLHPSSLQGDGGISAVSAVQGHLDLGIPADKIVLGVPFYGRGWSGVSPENNGRYQPAAADAGSFAFHVLVRDYIDRNSYARFWDDEAQVPYLWNDAETVFITYEDEESIRRKCEYVRASNLGGIMFWAYGHDHEGRLLNAAHACLTLP